MTGRTPLTDMGLERVSDRFDFVRLPDGHGPSWGMFALDPLSDAALRGLSLTLVGLAWVIIVVRLIGLRTFSKMTAFDFVVTLATGSCLASAATASSWSAFVQAMIAIAALLVAQMGLAFGRKSSKSVHNGLENEPLLLMRDGEFIEKALKISRVSRSDVVAKLREANALQLSRVRAVVLETTGDISVLHGEQVDAVLLEGVRQI
ncbi:DUF421 domain-containing protein [Stakelama sediminis]|uniref:Uncharacterized membrane protein YcaP (DUF421 family) n=1 Tax=Stakelama sediminis TaxID=463200 RepID=A0A840Z2H8_9SPHN|nr:YetF domain-containing protein [Stakelama sediminis]MBB5720093.1 uncharacterized membrane protein YcaP (DUF421 family) [Stakelama sediminis]